MKILFISSARSWRGGENQLFLLARELTRNNRQLLVLAPQKAPLIDRCKQENINCKEISYGNELSLKVIKQIKKIARDFQPNLIHANDAHSHTWAMIVGKLLKLPVVVTRRVSFPLRKNFFNQIKYKAVAAIVCVSYSIAKQLKDQGLPENKLSVIHSCIDIERLSNHPTKQDLRQKHNWKESDKIIGFVGQLVPHKSPRTIIEIVHNLKDKHPHLYGVFVGTGEQEEELKKLTENYRLNDKISFLGFYQKVEEILPALDMLILPSISGEGSPGVIKAAMIMGVPVIATDCGGIKEVIWHNETGLVTPIGDLKILTQTVEKLLSQPEEAQKLVQRAQKEALRRFSPERLTEAYKKLYQQLIFVQ